MQDDFVARIRPLTPAEMERLDVWQKTISRRWDRLFAPPGDRIMSLRDRFERFTDGLGFEDLGRWERIPVRAGSGDGLIQVADAINWLVVDNPDISRDQAVRYFVRCVERGDFGWRLRPTLRPKDAHPEDYKWRVVADLVDLFAWNDRSVPEGAYLLRPLLSTVRERPLTMWSRRSVLRRWAEHWGEEYPEGVRVPQELGEPQVIDIIPAHSALEPAMIAEQDPLPTASGTEASDDPPAEPASTEPPAEAAVKTRAAGGENSLAGKPRKAPAAAAMVAWYDNHPEKGKPGRTPNYFADLWCKDHPHPDKDQSRWARTVFKNPGNFRGRN